MYDTIAKVTMTITNVGLLLGFIFWLFWASLLLTPFIGIPVAIVSGSMIYSLWFMACSAYTKFMKG